MEKQKAPPGCYYTPVNLDDWARMKRQLLKEGYRLTTKSTEPVLFQLHRATWTERFTEDYTKP